jgi:glycosyltransferase involved in cell wall biosynthesis
MNITNRAGQLRIGINAHLLSSRVGYRRAGIHRYISQQIRHLQPPDEYRVTVFTNNTETAANEGTLTFVSSKWPTERRMIRILWEQLALPVLAVRQNLDLLHGMAFVLPYVRTCPTVVTIFDLSFIHYPERFPALQRIYLTSQTRRSCQAARRVVAISESTARDLERYYGILNEKIDIVMPGVGREFHLIDRDKVDSFRKEKRLSDPYLLHVGTLQPRKNIPFLVKALAKIRRPNLKLVLVGGKGWNYNEIYAAVEKYGLVKQVDFRGFVADTELPLWYNAATATIFPSLYEGFGLPVLEAMACGSPVIAANTSAIPEVAGKAALLYEPDDLSGLIDHIAIVLDDPQLAAKMQENGLSRANRFSWQRASQEMITVYDRALHSE